MKYALDQLVMYRGARCVVYNYDHRYKVYTLKLAGVGNEQIRGVDEEELSIYTGDDLTPIKGTLNIIRKGR